MAFRAGDNLDVLDYEGEWWVARLGDEIGEVPYNFLSYEDEASSGSIEFNISFITHMTARGV